MRTYSIEIRLRGMTIKFVAIKAPDALQAINNVCSLYAIGPYEFVARRVVS
jgi:hypothetical protein